MKILSLLTILLLLPSLCFGAASTSFDGTNDEVDMSTVLDVTTGNVSGCFWANLTENAVGDVISGKKNDGAAGSAGYQIKQRSDDFGNILISDGVDQFESAGTTDIDGAWHHVCGTYNATTQTTVLYTDGVQEDTDTSANVGSLTNAVEYAVGESGSELGDATGLVAHVSQHSAVLTVVEVNELMWKPESIPTSRGGFWPLFDTGGNTTIENDLSGNNFDGTVSGATDSTSGPPVMFAMGAQ